MVTKMLAGGRADTTERILVESLCDRFIGQQIELFGCFAGKEEKQLCSFAFICETVNLASFAMSSIALEKVTEFLSQQIKKCAKPAFYSEEVQGAYFELLFSLMDKSFQVFASKAGLEFLAIVANSPLLLKFERNLRQLILS
jgi:hypothetical protein